MSVLCVNPAGNWTSAKAICSVPTHDLLSRSNISALLTLQLTTILPLYYSQQQW